MQLLLFLIALIFGIYGIFTGHIISLLFAAILIFGALSGIAGVTKPADAARASRAVDILFGDAWKILTACSLCAATAASWFARVDPTNHISGYLWMAGLILIVAAALVHDRYHLSYRQGWAHLRTSLTTFRQPPKWNLVDWGAVTIVTILALGLRLYKLSAFLPGMHGDEGEMGMLALQALHGPQYAHMSGELPLFSTAFLDHPTLFHYLQAAGLFLFGESISGLRMVSVLFGAFCVPLIYGIGWVGWGRLAGFTAAWLLAVSHLHIQYSRIALNNIETVWMATLFILLLALAREQHAPANADPNGEEVSGRLTFPSSQLTLFTLAGLTMGVSQYFYYGSRLLPVLAVPLILFLIYEKRAGLGQVVALITATVIAYAPIAVHYAFNAPAFINRTVGVSIINPDALVHTLGPGAAWPMDIPRLLYVQFMRNAHFFVRNGDVSAFYLADLNAFGPLTALLFWLGLGVTLTRIWRYHEFSLLAWFGLGFLLAGVLTNDAPNGPRLIVITPALFAMGGVFVQRTADWLQATWVRGGRRIVYASLASLLVITLVYNYNVYFVKYAQRVPNNLLPISVAETILAADEGRRIYFMGAPNYYAGHGVIRFVARNKEVTDILDANELAADLGPDVLFIILPHRMAEIGQIAEQYPNGVTQSVEDPVGRQLFLVYASTGEQVEPQTYAPNQ